MKIAIRYILKNRVDMCDYGEYDGNIEHDMWVDYTYHVNTGELDDWFDDECPEQEDFIPSSPYISHSSSYISHSSSSVSSSSSYNSLLEQLDTCQFWIGSYDRRISKIESDIDGLKKEIEQSGLYQKETLCQKLEKLENSLSNLQKDKKDKEEEEAKILSLLAEEQKFRNACTITLCVLVIIISVFVFWWIY